MQVKWNPWHGCTKISPGCEHCYVYRMDKRFGRNPEVCNPTNALEFPIWKNRKGEYKLPYDSDVMLCFTSDFLLESADEFREKAWNCIRERSDCNFMFVTKRINRFMSCIPDDWNDGWDNVIVCCTCENQEMANYRLNIFKNLPIKHKSICLEPLLEYIDINQYLDDPSIVYVISGGESGPDARVCDYKWAYKIMEDCHKHNVKFWFKQTGARFINEHGDLMKVARCNQYAEADKLGLSNISLM